MIIQYKVQKSLNVESCSVVLYAFKTRQDVKFMELWKKENGSLLARSIVIIGKTSYRDSFQESTIYLEEAVRVELLINGIQKKCG